jgi:hypothetical protein
MADSLKQTLLLKELDHLQSAVGRYDNFFFLAKQLCFGSAGYLLLQSNSSSRNLYLIVVPIIFYAMELGFRYTMWSWYLSRIREIRRLLLAKDDLVSLDNDNIYRMSPAGSSVGYRLNRSLQPYDFWFYGLLLAAALYNADHNCAALVAVVAVPILSVIKKALHKSGLQS